MLTLASCAPLPPLVLDPPSQTCRQVVGDAAVAWVPPSDARSRAAMPRWCATIGPAYFRSRPDGPSDFSSPSRPSCPSCLVVVTWNVHVGGGDIEDFVTRLERGEFTGGERVTRFVLLLQEVVRRDDRVPAAIDRRLPVPHRINGSGRATRTDLREIARAHGLALLYAPAMRNANGRDALEDRGNAIASTLPLQDAEILELPFVHQRRVVPIATVGDEAGSWRIRLANVHFDTALALIHGGPSAARRREAQAVIAALASSKVPTVVAGDLNTWLGGNEPAVALLTRAFPDTPPTQPKPTWRGPLGLAGRLDYIFVRGGPQSVTLRRLSNRFGSDHHPLVAVLRF